jgi:hypothetical protein
MDCIVIVIFIYLIYIRHLYISAAAEFFFGSASAEFFYMLIRLRSLITTKMINEPLVHSGMKNLFIYVIYLLEIYNVT